jgi:hypothetical protein
VIAPAFALQIKQLRAAAFASAVGMRATRLRGPSEAAFPQSSPPRLLMVSPVRGDYRRCQAEIPLIVLCRFPGPALRFTL